MVEGCPAALNALEGDKERKESPPTAVYEMTLTIIPSVLSVNHEKPREIGHASEPEKGAGVL